MPSFPSSVYTPRPIENKPGTVYDETKTRVIYAEDIVGTQDEVKAIEACLVADSETPLPFGFRCGDSVNYFTVAKVEIEGLTVPVIAGTTGNIFMPVLLGIQTGVAYLTDIFQRAGMYFVDVANGKYVQMFWNAITNAIEVSTNMLVYSPGSSGKIEVSAVTEDGNETNSCALVAEDLLETATLEIGNATKVRMKRVSETYDGVELSAELESGPAMIGFAGDVVVGISQNQLLVNGSVILNGGIYGCGESYGQDATRTYVGALRMNGGSLQYQTVTLEFKGGILVDSGTLSDWITV